MSGAIILTPAMVQAAMDVLADSGALSWPERADSHSVLVREMICAALEAHEHPERIAVDRQIAYEISEYIREASSLCKADSFGDCILDYTEELVNKINGQADTTVDSRNKFAKAISGNEERKPNSAPSLPWPPLSVRRAAAVLRDFYPLADPALLSVVGASVAAADDDHFGNGIAGQCRARRISVVAFEATLEAICPKEPATRTRRNKTVR